MQLEEGIQLGQFVLSHELGRGSFATVWEAFDTKLQRQVAIKIPRDDVSEELKQAFLQEARNVASLKHRGIVEIYEIVSDGKNSRPYLVLECIQGVTLTEWCEFVDATYYQIADLIAQTAFAIHHAHQQGIVHRDLKPANILVDLNAKTHVTDFGLATKLESFESQDDVPAGTIAYMAPEQATTGTVGPASDVFALGAILFELLTKELPYKGSTRAEYLKSIASSAPRQCRQIRPQVPKALSTICGRCLVHDPEDRYASAQELGDELVRYMEGMPILAEQSNPVVKVGKWFVRHRRAARIVGSIFVLVISLIGYAAYEQYCWTVRTREATNMIMSLDRSHVDKVPALLEDISANRKDVQWVMKSNTVKPQDEMRPLLGRLACGQDQRAELIQALATFRGSECDNIVKALRLFGQLNPIPNQPLLPTTSVPQDSKTLNRLAILSAHLGDRTLLEERSAANFNPDQRTELIEDLADFHGDWLTVISWMRDTRSPELQFVIALATGKQARELIDSSRAEPIIHEFIELKSVADDPGVAMGAWWACRQLASDKLKDSFKNSKPSPTQSASKVVQDFGDLKFVRIDAQRWETERTTEHPATFYVAATEVPLTTYQQFASTSEWTLEKSWKPLFNEFEDGPANCIPGVTIPLFCNWLSQQAKRAPCYERGGDIYFGEKTGWTLHPERNGFRLPYSHEWMYAARALSNDKYFHGNASRFRDDYCQIAWTNEQGPIRVAQKMPNRFGLFDMAGSLAELCHGPDQAIYHFGGNYTDIDFDGFIEGKIHQTLDTRPPVLGIRLVFRD